MNKILDQFEKQPLAVKLGILLLVVAIMGVLEYQMYYAPKMEEISNLDKQSAALKVKLTENQAIADNLPKFREEVDILNEELKRAVELLPNDAEIHGLYRQLSNEAKKTNVDLVNFRPGGRSDHGFYSSLDMQIKIEGSFFDIASFIDQVGKLSRIINISDLVFSGASVQGNLTKMTVDAKATTFMFSGGKG